MHFLTPEFRERFMRSVRKTESCWMWTRPPKTDGYGQVNVSPRKNMSAHRVSYLMHHGPILDGLSVLHSCDTKMCVNPDHLRLGTQRENIRDMTTRNRQAKGTRVGGVKLNEGAVIEMRRRHAEGQTMTQLAREFGVGLSTVHRTIRRYTWKHVTGQFESAAA